MSQRPSTSRLVSLGLAVLLWSGPALSEPLTQEGAEERALAASPALRIARLEVAAAKERTSQAWSRHLGDADLVVLANHFEGARLVRPIAGPLTPATTAALPFDANQLHGGLTWQIPLFTGGALLEGDRAASLLESAARAQSEHTQAELRYNVRAAFRNALNLDHALTAVRGMERALEQSEAAARLRVQAEASTNVDALKVGFALASAQARRAQLETQLRTARGLLAALMGEEAADFELTEPPEPALEEPAPGTADGLQRRDLVSLRTAAEAQTHRAAAVRAGFWPQLAFAGNVFLNAGLEAAPSAPTFEVSVLLKLPVLASLGRVPALREAEAQEGVARERARARALEVGTQVLDARGRVEAARAALLASTSQRTLGAEVARVEKLKFDAGTGRIEDYLLALAQQFDAEAAAWQARYSLQTALDYLVLATGTGGSR
jgi:outer membrane protein TolC